jgi:hypothetical protein
MNRSNEPSAAHEIDHSHFFVGPIPSLGIEAHKAKTVKDATDLIAKGLKDGSALLIDVDMERNYKPM